MTDLTGGCACGQVRFTAIGAPKFAFLCQCRDCQQMTGSAHAAQFCHDASAFSVTGALAQWDRKGAEGHIVSKFTCATCACPIYGTTSRATAIVMVMAGALEDPAAITPDRIFFADSAIPWDHATVAPAP